MESVFNILIIFILLLILIVLLLVFFKATVNKRHQKNISSAKKIIQKINNSDSAISSAQIISYLRKISPYVFEELLLTALENKGFEIQRNRRYTGDGGIDGRVTKNGQLFFVQAKRYKGYVSKEHIIQFQKRIGDHKGLFIHTGKTGRETFDQFRHSNVTIISGDRLLKLIAYNFFPEVNINQNLKGSK